MTWSLILMCAAGFVAGFTGVTPKWAAIFLGGLLAVLTLLSLLATVTP